MSGVLLVHPKGVFSVRATVLLPLGRLMKIPSSTPSLQCVMRMRYYMGAKSFFFLQTTTTKNHSSSFIVCELIRTAWPSLHFAAFFWSAKSSWRTNPRLLYLLVSSRQLIRVFLSLLWTSIDQAKSCHLVPQILRNEWRLWTKKKAQCNATAD